MTSLLQSRAGVLSEKHPATPDTIPEAEWLLTCVVSNGGICEEPPDYNGASIRPYMANYACMGLARAYEVTSHTPYLTACWNWLAWYRDHMDPVTGYVDDYDSHDGVTFTDNGNKDSTDAYAGTYLVALYLTYWADPNGDANLAPFAASIPLALTAIEATQQSDGLTYALPTYDVKYLEDNIETLAGARAAHSLGVLAAVSSTQPAVAARAQNTADMLATGIGYMWNHDAGTWDYAIHASRVYAHNDWSDENAQRQQVWATGWSAVASEAEGRSIMAAYVAARPGWATQFSPGYEPMPVWGYRHVNQTAEANAGATALEATGVTQERGYPWTCAISGMVLVGLLGFSTAMPSPLVIFPAGVNLIPDPQFLVDSNSDGRADAITGTYGSPTTSLHPLTGGGSYQSLDSPDGNGWAVNWDNIPVTPNTYVTFSLWERVTRVGAGGTVTIQYELYDSSGTFVTYGYNQKAVVDGPDFHRWYINAWIPPGVAYLRPVLGIASAGVDIAYPQVEKSGSPSAPPYGVPVPAAASAVVVDHFADAQYITAATGTLTYDGSGFDSAAEIPPLNGPGGTPNIGYDGWIGFTPTKACSVTFDTHGTGLDTLGGAPDTELDVYALIADTVALGNLWLIARNDDFGDATSQVTFTCQGGITYFVQVGAHNVHHPSTTMKLTWSGIDFSTPADPVHARNDLFSQAQEISGSGQDVPFSNYDYTTEAGEPHTPSRYRSAWYHFVPTSAGSVELDSQLMAPLDTYLVLYSGPPGATMADLTEVTHDDDGGGGSTSLISGFAVSAGQDYWAQLTMYNSSIWSAQSVLRWSIP